MNSLEARGASSLALVYMLRMIGLFMVLPILPIMATDYPDYSPFLLGLAIGGYGVTQALLQIPFGVLSDRVGRKPIIVFGLVLFACGSMMAALADSLLMVTIGRFLQGAGAIAGAVMALAGDISRESERPKVMAIIGVAIGFSFYLALLLGPVLGSAWGLTGVFGITAVLALLSIVVVIWLVPTAMNHAPTGDTLPNWRTVKTLFGFGVLPMLNVSVFVLHGLLMLLFVQLPEQLSQQGWALAEHWQLYLPVLALSIVGLVVLMRLSRVWSVKATLLISVLIMALVFGVFAAGGLSLWTLLVMIWLFFSAFNFIEANLPALVSGLAPAGQKGSAMGIYSSFQFGGAALGGMLAGALLQWLSPDWIFAVATVVCVLWGIVIGRSSFSTQRQRRHQFTLPEGVNPKALVQELRQWSGVEDVTVVESERTLYIKVDTQAFSRQKAYEFIQHYKES